MSKNSELTELRAALDNAITYGTQKESLKVARHALKISEDKASPGEIRYFKGQLAMLKRDFARAIEHFDAAININPGDGGSYNDRALCMVELGIIDDAVKFFDKGIEVEPDYATIYHNKGWLLNNLGEHRKAIKYFNKALELEPKRAVTYDNLADAYFNIDELGQALECYAKVLELLKPGKCRMIRSEIKRKIKWISEQLTTLKMR
jgi:tetratricopeptide (TPR) repeat protein